MYRRLIYAIIKIVILVVWWRIGTLVKALENKRELKKLQKYAKKIDKPILNLGCGKTDYGGINADVIQCDVKNFKILDANRKLPFKDKQFSSVFASNIIEHLSSPKFSLKEMKRVANKVYIGHPKWWQLGTWLTPDHLWLVFKKDSKFKFIRYRPIFAYIILALLILL